MESVLSTNSLSKLSDFGQQGTGFHHILRTLIQSAEGISTVAVSASLAESYNIVLGAYLFSDWSTDQRSEVTNAFILSMELFR
jgi:hypothetical protein